MARRRYMHLSNLIDFSETSSLERGESSLVITHLTSDSRTAQNGSLFAAIDGNSIDGKKFIPDAIKNGAIAILTDSKDIDLPDHVALIITQNVRAVFAKACAKFWPSKPGFIAAVTGTNGKSSTVEFLRQIWERNTWNAASLGTLGARSSTPHTITTSGLTTPSSEQFFSVLNDFSKHNISYLALEASSHGLDQQRIQGLSVQVAVFTNLSRDHLDYHTDMNSYFAAKEKLFSNYLANGGYAVVNYDDVFGKKLIESLKNRPVSIKTFGEDEAADFYIASILATDFGLELTVIYQEKKYICPLGLTGFFQAKNALCAAITSFLSGLPIEIALRSMSFLTSIDGRMQPIHGHPNGALIVIDYAHSPEALKQVLVSLRKQTGKKLHVVFGCGGERDEGKRPLMGKIAHEFADNIFITDDNPRNESPQIIRAEIMAECPNAIEIGNRDEAIAFAIQQLQEADCLLIAGKGHESLQLIGSETLPFSDAVVARNTVKRLAQSTLIEEISK